MPGNFDVVIGSDLVYDRAVVPVFVQMLQETVGDSG
eukprot:CAMPEP_0184490190 /NCGR_PEP_ID=MMETSP0113_2-20130426/17255_1 /TAXON_ID=91329 /ORGANISM="Norrisiella sphaerica, Strain BC52" /LENGTH=35 /DNA_ID= /DNA_START= /DNA_END= /DNA_ORIENTATION=